MKPAVNHQLFFNDTQKKPWSFSLYDEDGNEIFDSKQYKSKAAAASVASRQLKKEVHVKSRN